MSQHSHDFDDHDTDDRLLSEGPYQSMNQPYENNEVLRCQWLDCSDCFESAEELYEHISFSHVGRKAAGTLTLQCAWGDCRAIVKKRGELLFVE